jgi:hypothetical protein
MASKEYLELLRDPRWQRKRLEILERDGWECTFCGDTKTTLHVHHRYYKRGKKPWEYDDEALTTLCETCHAKVTETKRLIDAAVAEFGVECGYDRVLLGYIEALVAITNNRPLKLRDWEHASGVAGVMRGDVRADDLLEIGAPAGYVINPADILRQVQQGTWKPKRRR